MLIFNHLFYETIKLKPGDNVLTYVINKRKGWCMILYIISLFYLVYICHLFNIRYKCKLFIPPTCL